MMNWFGIIGVGINLMFFLKESIVNLLHSGSPSNSIKIPHNWVGRKIQVNMERIETFPNFIKEFGTPFVFRFCSDCTIKIYFQLYHLDTEQQNIVELVLTPDDLFKRSNMFEQIPSEHNYTLFCLNSSGEEFLEPLFNTTVGIRSIIASRIILNLSEMYYDDDIQIDWISENTPIEGFGVTISKIPVKSGIISHKKELFDNPSFTKIANNLDVPTTRFSSEPDIATTICEIPDKQTSNKMEVEFKGNSCYGKWSLFQDIFLPISRKEMEAIFPDMTDLPNINQFEDKKFRKQWFELCIKALYEKYPGRVTQKFVDKAWFEFQLNMEWISEERPNIFIESNELCDLLMESSCKVDVEKIFVDQGGFLYSFSLPMDYKFNGIPIPSFLVKCEKDDSQSKIYMTVMIRSGFFMGITEASVIAYEDLVENYDQFSWKTYMGLYELTSDYIKFVVAAAKKLAIMTLLYKQTHPDKFVDGYPPIDSLDVLDNTKSVRKSKTLSLDKKYLKKKKVGGQTVAEISPHWRRPHFATLRHKDFRREPDGSFRIILRKGSHVNYEKMRAKTLLK